MKNDPSIADMPHEHSSLVKKSKISDPNITIHDDKVSASSHTSTLSCLGCCFKDVEDRNAFLIVMVSMLNFIAIGLTLVPLKLLINQRIAGDATDPNSKSSFVDTTNIFLYAFTSFLCGRYTSGLGDYVGRKPMLLFSASVVILTRFIYVTSNTASGFYIGAVVGGACDCFYFSGIAWICDFFPEGYRRNKRMGIYVGLVLGLSLTLSAPIGAVLATSHPTLPFYISPFFSIACILMLLVMPVDDTRGIIRNSADIKPFPHVACWRSSNTSTVTSTSKRCLPADWSLYLTTHFPISPGTMDILHQAQYPLDWISNFLMQSVPSLLGMILIQYFFSVFDWSPAIASVAVFSVGLCLAIFGPPLLNKFDPVPLAFYAMCLFTVGLIMLCIAGTGISVGPIFGGVGIVCVALGTSWIPALQTNLTTQYGAEMQGVVSGLLSQQKDLSMLPGYLMSLAFTFNLKRQNGVYFPGAAFLVAACMGITAIAIHYYIHGADATTLTLRKSAIFPPANSVGDSAAAGGGDIHDDEAVDEKGCIEAKQQHV